MRTPSLVGMVLAALALSSCAPAKQAPRAPEQLPVLALSQQPTLQIGVMEGDVHYTFQDVVSVLPLPSGEVVVSDGGAGEITVYTPDGTYVRRWGGRGKGPGEFRALSRIYAGAGDSIMAEDGVTARVSVFDTTGEFARQVDARELSGDSLFRMDAWLYRRFWVDGAPRAATRARVKRTLNELPSPTSAPGYRVVRVASDGRLWVREPDMTPDGTRTWTVFTAQGTPEAVIDMPGHFQPLYFGQKRIFGRWLGESDVNFVRAYDLERSGRTALTPDWISAPPDTTTVPPADEKQVRTEIVAAIRTMAGAQEMHYATHMTYTTEIDSLKWEQPENVTVAFVSANARGWSAVFTHPGFDRICGLGYGYNIPPGWQPGTVLCAPPVAAAAAAAQER